MFSTSGIDHDTIIIEIYATVIIWGLVDHFMPSKPQLVSSTKKKKYSPYNMETPLIDCMKETLINFTKKPVPILPNLNNSSSELESQK